MGFRRIYSLLIRRKFHGDLELSLMFFLDAEVKHPDYNFLQGPWLEETPLSSKPRQEQGQS